MRELQLTEVGPMPGAAVLLPSAGLTSRRVIDLGRVSSCSCRTS